MLLDSGASGSIVSKTIAKKLRLTNEAQCVWNTAAGLLVTNKKTKLQFMLPELSETKLIEWKMHVLNDDAMNYDIIIGRDILEELGIIIDFKNKQITWDEISTPMRSLTSLKNDGYFINDSDIVNEATKHTTRILDAHYEAANLDEIVANCHNLNDKQKSSSDHYSKSIMIYLMELLEPGRTKQLILN